MSSSGDTGAIPDDEDGNGGEVVCSFDKSRQKNVRPVRVFNAWVEEWERPMLQQKDFINQTQILNKCGGLCFLDETDESNPVLV